jgi:hypothetical protein
MSTKRLQKKKAAMQAKKDKQLKKNTSAATATKKIVTAKVEPKKIETSRTEAVKIETSKSEPIKVETSKTEPIKVETSKTEPIKLNSKINIDLVFKSICKTLKLLSVCRDIQGKVKILRSIRIIWVKMFSKADSLQAFFNGCLDHNFHRSIGICGKRGVHMAVP